MTVRAILDTKGHHILSVEPEAKLSAAVKILGERKIGAVLVMSNGRVEGILSERDIVRVLGERGASVLDGPVSEVMTRKVVSCRQSDTVSAIMEMMTNGKFRHLPVLEGDRVVGLISIGDIVKWRVQEYENEQEALRQYIKTALVSGAFGTVPGVSASTWIASWIVSMARSAALRACRLHQRPSGVSSPRYRLRG